MISVEAINTSEDTRTSVGISRFLQTMNVSENPSELADIHQLPNETNVSENPSELVDIHDLPYEILIKIIASLPLTDRKNTRLVCRRWFSVNNEREVSKKEKFVFRSGNDDLLSVIQMSERKVLNVQFLSFTLFYYDSDFASHRSRKFWSSCGPRIEWVYFDSCRIPEQTLQFVCENCIELKSIIIVDNALTLEDKEITFDETKNLLLENKRRRHGLKTKVTIIHMPTPYANELEEQEIRAIGLRIYKSYSSTDGIVSG